MNNYIYSAKDRYEYMISKNDSKGDKKLESFFYLVANNDYLYRQLEDSKINKNIDVNKLLDSIEDKSKPYLEICLAIGFDYNVPFDSFLKLKECEMKNVINAIEIKNGEIDNGL